MKRPLSWLLAAPLFLTSPILEAQSPPAPKEAPKPEPKISDKELGMKIWQTLSGSASAVDNCTSRYLEEFPKAKGSAAIAFKVAGKGSPESVNVSCALESSDKLSKCLRDVGRSWSFPQKVTFDLSIEVKVLKGQKFQLLKPGEQPPPPPKEKQGGEEEQGWITFQPPIGGGTGGE